jgi:hypothetical protein
MIGQTIYQKIRAFLATAWRAIQMVLRGPDAGSGTIRPVFAGIWQDSGRTYSIILAQAGALSQKYRHLFLSEVAKLVDTSGGLDLAAAERKIAAEHKEVRVPSERSIHMFLRSSDFVVLGFEDSEAATLQRKKSLRYDEYLRARHPQPLLAFISPGTYEPSGENARKLRRFVPVDDGRLVGWADECLIDWLGSAELRLGQASEMVGRCFGGSPAPMVRLDLSSGGLEPVTSSRSAKSRDTTESWAQHS